MQGDIHSRREHAARPLGEGAAQRLHGEIVADDQPVKADQPAHDAAYHIRRDGRGARGVDGAVDDMGGHGYRQIGQRGEGNEIGCAELVEAGVDQRQFEVAVDQGAAVLLCSYESARDAGVSDDRMVFLHAAAEVHDHYFFSERWSLAESPGIAAAVGDALDAAGLSLDDIARFDLYSCFPSAVQIGAAALGIADDDPRPLTVTGGLGFAGGPVNNYPTHAIARMVELLRNDPMSYGCTTALGWYISKHATGVWSGRPPAAGFQRVDPAASQAKVDATPRRRPAGLLDEEATIEATSVSFERDGNPSLGIVTALTGDGRRAIANVRDPDLLAAFTTEAHEGRPVRLTNDGTTNTAHLP